MHIVRSIKDALLALLAFLLLSLFIGNAFADEEQPYSFRLVVDTPKTDYSYRRENDSRTVALMMYGFQPASEAAAPSPSILKDRKALSGFFKQHLETVKHDYLGQDGTQKMNVLTGDDSFISAPMNRDLQQEPAKMVGVTLPFGKMTFGAGYTWGEKNPAVMLPTTEGLIVGASYDTGKTGFQLSYLTSGHSVGGFEVGGGTKYDSLMFGTSWRVNQRMGVTATAQYRRDNDDLTTGDTQAVFTIGTMWKF